MWCGGCTPGRQPPEPLPPLPPPPAARLPRLRFFFADDLRRPNTHRVYNGTHQAVNDPSNLYHISLFRPRGRPYCTPQTLLRTSAANDGHVT